MSEPSAVDACLANDLSEPVVADITAPGGRRRKGTVPPVVIAEKIIESVHLVSDESGQVRRYAANGAWKIVPEIGLKQMAMRADENTSTVARRNEIVEHVRVASHRPGHLWGRAEPHEIACQNGIVDALTERLRPHSPDNFLLWTLPWAYMPGATSPVWDTAMASAFGDGEDDGRQAAVEDFMGYICTQHARWKRALMLKGGHDTGKSATLGVMQDLVGRENCCQLPLEYMDDPQKRSVIVGAALNVITEVTSNALIADGGFKTLVSTEEPVLIDQKYRVPIMLVPTAKHVVATNNMPRINDRTEATFRRFLIVLFDREIPAANRDPRLREKMLGEMPGILNVAIRGLRRVVERDGQFIDPPGSKTFIEELRDDSNPVRAFMRERAILAPDAFTPLIEVTNAYNRWLAGGKKASTRLVGKLLRDAGWHDIRVGRARLLSGPDDEERSGPPCVGLHGVRIMGDMEGSFL